MIIRLLQPKDLDEIKLIHEANHAAEFRFPDWSKFISSFVVESADGRIITAGGIQPMVEIIAVTDKKMPVRMRRNALLQLLEASVFVAGKNGLPQIHATIMTDDDWANHLKRHGFNDCKGKFLYLQVL